MPFIIVTEKLIEAPINKVWEKLTDFDAYAHWNPFIINATRTMNKLQPK